MTPLNSMTYIVARPAVEKFAVTLVAALACVATQHLSAELTLQKF